MKTTYMEPDKPAKDYHAGPEASAGFLKKMLQSPMHAKHSRDNPSEPSPIMRFGTAWHSAFFEPEKFAQEYATGHDAHPATSRAKLLDSILAGNPLEWLGTVTPVPDDISLKTKEGKALAADIEAQGRTPIAQSEFEWIASWVPKLHGRTVISQEWAGRIAAMNASAHAHPITKVFLNPKHGGIAEPSIYDRDPATGIMVRIRPDYLIPPCPRFPNGVVLDGKSTGDASPGAFGRTAWNLAYYIQAALYTRVVQRLFNTPERPPFVWLAVEADAPHAAAYYRASTTETDPDTGMPVAGLIEYGDSEVDRLLAIYAECERTGHWPGYHTTIETLAAPAWASKAMNDNDEIASISYA